MPTSARIAFVGSDRQIHVISADGSGRRQITWPKIPSALTRWGGGRGEDACLWPGWSPDGRWLACFQFAGPLDGGGPARICAVEVDGVEERYLAELEGKIPIYAQWSPDGRRLAALVQDEDVLQLWVCSRDDLGRVQVAEEGVPLFFSWAPGSQAVALHAGAPGSRGGRLLLRDLSPRGEDAVFRDPPGAFCSPLFVGERLLYATGRGWLSNVCLGPPDGSAPRVLAAMEGLLALIPAPGGRSVAVASAPGGEGSPYSGIWIVPAEGGEMRRIFPEECQAFFWAPGGERLVCAQVDPAGGVRWIRLDLDGTRADLGRSWPSRDQLFYLHFFEQYCHSHPPISPDGRALVFSGHLQPGTSAEPGGYPPAPRLWVVDLTAERPRPEELVEGSFGVFPP